MAWKYFVVDRESETKGWQKFTCQLFAKAFYRVNYKKHCFVPFCTSYFASEIFLLETFHKLQRLESRMPKNDEKNFTLFVMLKRRSKKVSQQWSRNAFLCLKRENDKHFSHICAFLQAIGDCTKGLSHFKYSLNSKVDNESRINLISKILKKLFDKYNHVTKLPNHPHSKSHAQFAACICMCDFFRSRKNHGKLLEICFSENFFFLLHRQSQQGWSEGNQALVRAPLNLEIHRFNSSSMGCSFLSWKLFIFRYGAQYVQLSFALIYFIVQITLI